MQTQIKECLTQAGYDSGEFDSLQMALSVVEFERRFQIKIPATEVNEEIFKSNDTIEAALRKWGAR